MCSKINKRYNFEWKIHSFRKEIVDDLKFAKCYLSNEFQIYLGNNETKWHFKLYIKDSEVSIYLQKGKVDVDDFTVIFGVNTCKPEDPAKFEFRSEHHSSAYNYSRGWTEILKTEKVFNDPQKYLKNDTLILNLMVELVENNEAKSQDSTIESKEYEALMTKYEEYFENKTFSDFIFVCSDGVEIPAHRLVLAMNSDVMKTKLGVDEDEEKAVKANIKDIDGETMTEVLRFLYSKKVNNVKELAPKLLYSAEKYELEDLKKHCVDLMIKNLCIDNALEYFILSEIFGLKYLQTTTVTFIKLNYKTICEKRNDWNKLEVKHWTILLDYFRKNDYIQVFESTLKRETLHNFTFDSYIRT